MFFDHESMSMTDRCVAADGLHKAAEWLHPIQWPSTDQVWGLFALQIETPLFNSQVRDAMKEIDGRKDFFLEKRRKVGGPDLASALRQCLTLISLIHRLDIHWS